MKLSKTFTIGATAALLVLAGCMEDDGTYDQTKTGALIGAAAGTALGTAISASSGTCDGEDSDGDSTSEDECRAQQNAQALIIGGAAGTAVGTAIGYNLDKQEDELRAELSGSGAVITNTGDRLIVTLPEAITFDVDSTSVKSSLYGPLQALASNINDYPGSVIQVVGHTDSTGDATYNQGLSDRRAQAVASILRADGVPSSRIQTLGMGENAPIASNDTESGRQQNRRVEINIIPQS